MNNIPSLPPEIILTPHDPADSEIIIAKTDLDGTDLLLGHYRAVKILIPGEAAERFIYVKIDQLSRKLGLASELISFMDSEILGKKLAQKYRTTRLSSLIPLQLYTAKQKLIDCDVHFEVPWWKKLKSFFSGGGGFKAVKLNIHDLGEREVYIEAYVLKKIVGSQHTTMSDIHNMEAGRLGSIITNNIRQASLRSLTPENHPNQLIQSSSVTLSPSSPSPSVASTASVVSQPSLGSPRNQIINILITNGVMNEDDFYTDDGLFLASAINGIVEGRVDLEKFKNLVSRNAQSMKNILIEVGKQMRDIKKTSPEIEIPISGTQYSFRITADRAVHIIKIG